ncbi:hypothetical protein SISNIDRAFT_111041 [Sistotremastrum niveocremeum HHB9708]|uniref:Uncharacterized protein n=2 Tax=Sistotremastraceae TaxID=3402574 RepID=A0A164TGZ0_9AGAM|nr:hypothetical protein SISNIDRAFT_111041 [Sistotremastrum niveocremeum HHB9708]KZT41266.1 hypothetical protein SISSUDRAFT_352497 [Sistotremastrum suecicum HHB10207 ss-3]
MISSSPRLAIRLFVPILPTFVRERCAAAEQPSELLFQVVHSARPAQTLCQSRVRPFPRPVLQFVRRRGLTMYTFRQFRKCAMSLADPDQGHQLATSAFDAIKSSSCSEEIASHDDLKVPHSKSGSRQSKSACVFLSGHSAAFPTRLFHFHATMNRYSICCSFTRVWSPDVLPFVQLALNASPCGTDRCTATCNILADTYFLGVHLSSVLTHLTHLPST